MNIIAPVSGPSYAVVRESEKDDKEMCCSCVPLKPPSMIVGDLWPASWRVTRSWGVTSLADSLPTTRYNPEDEELTEKLKNQIANSSFDSATKIEEFSDCIFALLNLNSDKVFTSWRRPLESKIRNMPSAAAYKIFHTLVSKIASQRSPIAPSELVDRFCELFPPEQTVKLMTAKSIYYETTPDKVCARFSQRLCDLYGKPLCEITPFNIALALISSVSPLHLMNKEVLKEHSNSCISKAECNQEIIEIIISYLDHCSGCFYEKHKEGEKKLVILNSCLSVDRRLLTAVSKGTEIFCSILFSRPKISDLIDFTLIEKQSQFLDIAKNISSASDQPSQVGRIGFFEYVSTMGENLRACAVRLYEPNSFESIHEAQAYASLFMGAAGIAISPLANPNPAIGVLVSLGVLILGTAAHYFLIQPPKELKRLYPLYNLSEEVARARINPLIGRDKIVRDIFELFKLDQHVILVGDSRVGKTCILLEVVRQLAERDPQKKTFGGAAALLTTSAKVFGGGEKGRLQRVIEEMKKYRDSVILSIDEMHLLVEDRATATHLRSALDGSPGSLRYFIGATTTEEYKIIERDESLSKRLTKIEVSQIEKRYMPSIMRLEARTLAPDHRFSSKAIEKIASLPTLRDSKIALTKIIQRKRQQLNRFPEEDLKEEMELKLRAIIDAEYDNQWTKFAQNEDKERRQVAVEKLKSEIKDLDRVCQQKLERRNDLLWLAQLRNDLIKNNVINSVMLQKFFQDSEKLNKKKRIELKKLFNKYVFINHFASDIVPSLLAKTEPEVGVSVDIDEAFADQVIRG